MRRLLTIIGAVLALAAPAAAQRTNVTATVTDPNGIPYAFGTVTAQIVPAGGSPFLPGNPPTFFSGTIGPVQMNGSGAFGPLALPDNAVVSPANTKWQFTVCISPGILPPAGIGAVCFTPAAITITGASQDISTQLNAVAPALGRGIVGASISAQVQLTAAPSVSMPFSSNPAVLFTDFFMQLTQNVTLTGPTGPFVQGSEIVVTVVQDGTGGRTLTWPGTFLNAPVVQSGAGLFTAATFQFCGTAGSGPACPANNWQNTDISPAGTGTVTNIATTGPISGGPITTTGTLSCPTCTTNAAALTANAVVIGGGLQAASTIAADTVTTHALFATAGAPGFRSIATGDLPVAIPIGNVGTAGLSATAPVAIAATGAITCTTCATTTNGGALSGTSPIAINAAGAISISNITGASFANFAAHLFFGNNTAGSAAAAPSGIGTSDTSVNWFVAGGGTAQAQTATLSPAATALTAGLTVCWKPSAANTGAAPTLAVNGLTATAIVKMNQAALIANDLITTQIACVIYDGVSFELVNPQAEIVAATQFRTIGTGTASAVDYAQGTSNSGLSPCTVATSICEQAPTAVTSYVKTKAGTAPVNNFSTELFDNTTGHVGSFAKMPQTAITSGTAYTNATTTFSSIVGGSGQTLSFSVEANTNYLMTCNVLWSASVATAGPKFQITGPASPTAVQYNVIQAVTATTDGTAGAVAFATSLNASGATVVAATNEPATISMGLVNGANAGTVTLQAAAQGVGTLTIQPGSFCSLQ